MISNAKEAAYDFCGAYITNRIASLQTEIRKLEDALGSETKSSAGDKHETGRAMIQLEREKLGRQLQEAEKTKTVFKRISKTKNTAKVGLGSLVQTNRATYFISISAGRLVREGTEIFCISAATPIGRMLLGKSPGDLIHFNGAQQKVLKIG